MDRLLVAGIDTILGANMAAALAPRFQVTGLSWATDVQIAGCDTWRFDGQPSSLDAIRALRPNWIVFCGAAAEASWDSRAPRLGPADVALARRFAVLAQSLQCEFTAISSDAVFTGPWMFHREGGTCYGESAQAKLLLEIERELCEQCEKTLLVRTHAFGLSPFQQSQHGLVEQIAMTLGEGAALELSGSKHATPILATDLAEILEQAYRCELRGLFHIAGSERISPFRFACLLADQFGWSTAGLSASETAAEALHEGRIGETSLQTRRLRKALEKPLPMIRDGIARLFEQHLSGFRDRFQNEETALLIPSRAA